MRSSASCIRCGFVAILVSLASLVGSPAAGQGGDASIIGQVTDQSGAVLPGVTVTATSPALQVPSVTDVTNEVGEYRLAPLPVGVYQVTYDLAGFRPSQREAVRLTVGFTARVDVALGLATVAESVTVSGAAPVVDVTATSGASLFTKEVLDLTPTTRNGAMSLLTMAPGVRSFIDIGGSQTEENAGAKAFGQAGQVYYTLEGVMGNNWTAAGGSGTFWDFQTIDEARVQSMATDPEFPTRGVQINAIVKSGGNDFHGGGLFAVTGNKLQSTNLDDELRGFGFEEGNSIRKQVDISADLGGRLLRNKLWFYGAGRYRDINRTVLGAYSEAPLDIDLDNIVTAKYVTQKYSYQANSAHRFIVFNLWERLRENAKMDSLRSWEAREDKKTAHPIFKAGWEGQFGNAVATNFQFGYAPHDSLAPFLNTGTAFQVGRTDLSRDAVTGENVVGGERSRHFLHQTKGSLTYYKANWAGGNHEIKVGGEHARTKNFRSLDEKPVNYHLRYEECAASCAQGGVPFDIVFFNAPVYPDGRQHTTSFFARDSWTIGRRLTLNLGARYASVAAFSPEQTRAAASGPSAVLFPAQTFPRVDLNTWNSFEPRLHAALDVSGDGRTVIKGGFGRYHHMRLLTPDVLNFVKNSIVYSIYQWRDLNGNNDYDAGETDLDPTGPDFLEQTGMEFDDLPPNFVNNPDEKQPRTDEWSVSLERELIPNFALRVTGLYTKSSDIFRVQSFLQPYESYTIPITNRDPGIDGRLGTGDDGGLVTYHEYPESLTGAGALQNFNDPKAGPQTYKSIEIAGVKRLANRWSLMASYSATKKNKPINAGLAVGAFDSFNTDHVVGDYNPNEEIFRADNTWDWDSKLLASYNFPGDIMLSSNFHHQSGEAYARQVRFTGGTTIPAIVLNVEEIGAHRLPSVNLLTFRVEKGIRMGTRKVAVRLDLHNALNANTVIQNQPRSGEEFLRPRAIIGPRLAELSATYTF
jgi:hypothetical protein